MTCQENNALAIIDIGSAKVTQLVGLGFKDHSEVKAKTKIYEFDPRGHALDRDDGSRPEAVPRWLLGPAL